MTMQFPSLPQMRRTGGEPFHATGSPLPFDLLSFWQWHASDLAGNALRGCIAEYVVLQALGANADVRQEWDAVDIRLPSGLTVEVKSAAYHQSWAQRKESPIGFSIAPALGWDSTTGENARQSIRPAKVYVFCLLAHHDRETLDPLNVSQWTFYVLATRILDDKAGSQKKINLASLLRLNPEAVDYTGLKAAVARAAAL